MLSEYLSRVCHSPLRDIEGARLSNANAAVFCLLIQQKLLDFFLARFMCMLKKSIPGCLFQPRNSLGTRLHPVESADVIPLSHTHNYNNFLHFLKSLMYMECANIRSFLCSDY